MNSKNERRVGINEARPILGDLVTAAQQGEDIILTRNNRPAARLTAYQEDTMTTTTSIAEYGDDGRIYVDGTEVGAYDADGGEWREPVKTLLRQYGWAPVDDWQSGEHAYDPATIRVRDIR